MKSQKGQVYGRLFLICVSIPEAEAHQEVIMSYKDFPQHKKNVT